MGLSWSHVLILVLTFVLPFGQWKINELMGYVAQGIESFRKGLADSADEPRRKC
jgi:Sec-independent protein translocase protein TatA